jgi:hypothetical protein
MREREVLSAKRHEIAFSKSIYFCMAEREEKKASSLFIHFVNDMIQYELPVRRSLSLYAMPCLMHAFMTKCFLEFFSQLLKTLKFNW